MSERRDEFLSDEDLDLRNLSAEELETYWRLWLTQAQAPVPRVGLVFRGWLAAAPPRSASRPQP